MSRRREERSLPVEFDHGDQLPGSFAWGADSGWADDAPGEAQPSRRRMSRRAMLGAGAAAVAVGGGAVIATRGSGKPDGSSASSPSLVPSSTSPVTAPPTDPTSGTVARLIPSLLSSIDPDPPSPADVAAWSKHARDGHLVVLWSTYDGNTSQYIVTEHSLRDGSEESMLRAGSYPTAVAAVPGSDGSYSVSELPTIVGNPTYPVISNGAEVWVRTPTEGLSRFRLRDRNWQRTEMIRAQSAIGAFGDRRRPIVQLDDGRFYTTPSVGELTPLTNGRVIAANGPTWVGVECDDAMASTITAHRGDEHRVILAGVDSGFVSVSPDGRYVVCERTGRVLIVDLDVPAAPRDVPDSGRLAYIGSFVAADSRFWLDATTVYSPSLGGDRSIRLIDVAAGSVAELPLAARAGAYLAQVLAARLDNAAPVAATDDDLAAFEPIDFDTPLLLWGRLAANRNASGASAVEFDVAIDLDTGTVIPATASTDGDGPLTAGRFGPIVVPTKYTGGANRPATSPDGSATAVIDSGNLVVRTADAYHVLVELSPTEDAAAVGFAWSPDGSWLVVTTRRTLRVFDPSGKELARRDSPYATAQGPWFTVRGVTGWSAT